MTVRDPNAPRKYYGVMVSSTFNHLQQHRAAVIDAVEGAGLHYVAMEQDSALPDGTVVDASLRKVRDAAAYIGIVGHTYGQIPICGRNPEKVSLTQLEFREARRLKRPMLIFIMGLDHPVTVAGVEKNKARARKLKAFRKEVRRATEDSSVHRVYREFNDVHDLAVVAARAMAELRRHLDAQADPASMSVIDAAAEAGNPVDRVVYVVCAEGDEEVAERLSQSVRKAGYVVTLRGTATAGGSIADLLDSDSPVVLCALARAASSGWEREIVDAHRANGRDRVFVAQMDDFEGAVQGLLEALGRYYPRESRQPIEPGKSDVHYLDEPTGTADFDVQALQRFRDDLRDGAATETRTLSPWEFFETEGVWSGNHLTRTGVLLFGRVPRSACVAAMVQCARYYGTDPSDEREIRIFHGTVTSQIVAAREFVAQRVRRGERPSSEHAQSTPVYDYPMLAVREIIANALVHRDYSYANDCVHVRLFEDRLEITSPGTWLGRDIPSDGHCTLQELRGQSDKRNFRLARLVSMVKLVEGEGSGIPTALQDCLDADAPAPRVTRDQAFITVTLWPRSPEVRGLQLSSSSSYPEPDGGWKERVFLSFASEQAGVAEQLSREWRRRGVDVVRFDDAASRAGRVVDTVERGISGAGLFVALMSPQYLRSSWCEQERALAIHRDTELTEQFIHVVEVIETPRAAAGLLRNYVWVDAKGVLTDQRLSAVSAQLPFGRTAVAAEDIPGFRDRHDELATLRGALQTAGGRELWVLVSPPLMGKTWLLRKLEWELRAASPRWTVNHLDLRYAPVTLRTDAPRLIGSLLDVETSPDRSLLPDDLRGIAARISGREGPQLFVLDSAELLAPAAAATVRSALTTVHRLVRSTGRGERFGLVIGTRRHDEWRGLGFDARTGQRFEALRLTEFGLDIVHQALLDLPQQFGVEERWVYAERLHRLSEGLPALLLRSVQWAQETAFLQMDRSGGSAAFDAVARDYIQDDLLSAESLLPMGAPRPAEALAVLRSMLRVLSTYRLYTQSHLTFHLDAGPALQQQLDDARWTRVDLWDALGQIALGTQQAAHEMWHEIEPSLRRLLYRYHHRTEAERVAAHLAARRFYEGWTRGRMGGREQQVVLVESLWHEASRLAIEQPEAVARLLPAVAVELAQTFGSSPMYEPAEFSDAVGRRLRDDDDLKLLVAGRDGLFDEIVKSVAFTVEGGR